MRPLIWLGAVSPGGLALPAARPTPAQVYAPRGVGFSEHGLVVADSGNHRLMLWHEVPVQDGVPADVVLGQPNAFTEGPAAGGRGAENGFHLPTGVLVAEGRLWVADAWHHRVLVWNEVPRASDTPPDFALGQPDLSAVAVNRGGGVSARSLYWPYGLGYVDGVLWVTDTGNRRVLGWHGLPEADRPADLVLGQPDFERNEENRGGAVNARSFRWPHAVAGGGGWLFVADAGNHRVLGWQGPFEGDPSASVVLGQEGFGTNAELPHRPQGAGRMRFPYGLAVAPGSGRRAGGRRLGSLGEPAGRSRPAGSHSLSPTPPGPLSPATRSHGQACSTGGGGEDAMLVVADTANNRLLGWAGWPLASSRPADWVLGQVSFAESGENRWTAVERDTFCWPYGIALAGGRLAVADSGNNRVMLWECGAGDALVTEPVSPT